MTTRECLPPSSTISSAGLPKASWTCGFAAVAIQAGSFETIACSKERVPSNPIGPPEIGDSNTCMTVSLAPRPAQTRPASLNPSQE